MERVVYHPSASDRGSAFVPSPSFPDGEDLAGSTTADRSAWISSGMRGFAFAIEKFGVERFKQNTRKAQAGYMEAIQRVVGGSADGAPPLPVPVPVPVVSSSREKLRSAAAAKAKELKDLARSKAEPMYAACQEREEA